MDSYRGMGEALHHRATVPPRRCHGLCPRMHSASDLAHRQQADLGPVGHHPQPLIKGGKRLPELGQAAAMAHQLLGVGVEAREAARFNWVVNSRWRWPLRWVERSSGQRSWGVAPISADTSASSRSWKPRRTISGIRAPALVPSMSWLSSEAPLWARVKVCVRFGGSAPNRVTDRPTHFHR